MIKIVFATNNKNKLSEIQSLVSKEIEILSLMDIKCNEELDETCNSLEGNALQKAEYVFNKYKYPCFADDTGLEIDALNGEPGVYSARYAGNNCSADDNIKKVLSKLNNKKNRKAKFRTVIALIVNNKKTLFEGMCKGEITLQKEGNEGFGYDPIFKPLGSTISFANMSKEQKNKISHRAIAVKKLLSNLGDSFI